MSPEDRSTSERSGLTAETIRALIDVASDVIAVLDFETGRVLDVNEAACVAFGYERAELLQGSVDSLAILPAGNSFAERRDRIIAAGGRLRFETPYRRADGSTFSGEVSARQARIDDRDYLIVTIRDVTERAHVEAALRASEQRFRLLVDELHVGVLVQGPKAEIVLSNPKALELLGLTEEQLLGVTSFDPSWNVIHEDGSPFPGKDHPVPVAIATGKPQRGVVMGVFRPTPGDRVWLLVDAEPQLDANGQVETVVCTFSDITALKEAEDALRTSEARLREAQRIASVGSFEWSRANASITWSDEMHRILGTDPERFVPTTRSFLAVDSPEEQRRVAAMFRQAAAANAPGYECELSLMRPDGEARDVHVRCEFRRDEQGTLVGIRGTLQDVTERKRAERSLAESEEILRRAQKVEVVGRLAKGIAHDFNNMLSPILGFSSMIKSELPQEDKLRERIEIIEEAAERAAALTKQLLAFSRHNVEQPQPVDVDGVVSGLERMLRRLIGEDIELTTRLGAKVARVLADPSQIEQVVLNLVVNSRDAMPKGGKLTIQTSIVTLEQRGPDGGAERRRYVRLSVSDTGTGIDQATFAMLWEPFFTTKEPGKGTGLGLPTVHDIVKRWRGDVHVESTVGEGTRFHVDLPCHEEAAEAPAPRPVHPIPVRPAAPVGILVVEDDELVRLTTCGLLRGQGYAVFEASNGEDGLVLAHDEPSIQLLVSDVVMPRMSGLELVSRARALRPDLKALLLSGYSPETWNGDPSLAASVALLRKPFKSSDLFRAVSDALGDVAAP